MNNHRLRRGAGILILAMSISVLSLPMAVSAATHVITLEQQIIFEEEGDRISLGTFDTPAELVGQVCSVVATGNNNTSVHPGNDIEVTSENTVVLAGVEDSPDKTTPANGSLTLSEQISFTLVLGPDGVYSASFDVTLECNPVTTTTSTTTTSEPSTTTTEATTTTSEPTTTTTEATTTTTLPPETSSTSVTSTTEPEATTTTEPPEVSPTTEVPPTTGGETTDTLPFTGVESTHLALMALVALGAGTGLVLLSLRSAED